MSRRRVRTGRGKRDRLATALVLGAMLLVLGPAPGRSDTDASSARAAEKPLATVSGAELAVSPAVWWTTGGSSTAILATWSGVPAGCAAAPIWFDWSVAAGGSVGYVAPENGSTVEFHAVAVESGASTVSVAAAATIACGANRTTVVRTATSVVHVDAPLAVNELRSDPAWSPGAGTATVLGRIVGGEPPYEVLVAWGTGNVTTSPVEGSGNFSVSGRPGAGSYDPSVTVTDATGVIVHGRVEENATRTGDFAIEIVPSTYIADAGLSVAFRLESPLPSSAYSTVEVCTMFGGSGHRPAIAAGGAFSCAFASPGVANISVTAVETAAPFRAASARLLEPVVPRLELATGSIAAGAEVGRTAYVPLTVVGGVPPYELRWRFVGNDSVASAEVPQDGTWLAPVAPAVPGEEEIAAQAVDALGEPAQNASAEIDVDAPLAASVATEAAPADGGTRALLSASVVAGAPPFDWAVASAVPAIDEPTGGGAIPDDGGFTWNGTLRAEGPLNGTLVVADAAGAVWEATLSFSAGPALAIETSARALGPGRWAGRVEIVGGAPPFRGWVNASDGSRANRSDLPDGSWNFTVDAATGGNLSVSVVVLDRLGVAVRSATWVVVPAPATPSSSSVGSADSAVAGAGVAVVAVYLIWRWRRARSVPPAAPADPVAILRSIIAPADGADRAVVELLAEEQGVPAADVRRTIDRLIADGTIRAERGADGEEIVAWRAEP